MTDATATKNPLLIGKGLPPFNEIKAEHVVPAMTQILAELDEKVSKLERRCYSYLGWFGRASNGD